MTGDRYPAADFGRRIHERLLAGDAVASAELAEAYLPRVVVHLRVMHPEIRDKTLLLDAAADALLNYVEHPTSFDPQKSGLLGYLKMSARGDLLNALEKERRRKDSERSAALRAVELEPAGRNQVQEDEELLGLEEERNEREVARSEETMRRVYEALPAHQDRQILELMMEGVRETEAYAEVLEISALDEVEQRKVVKRNKDRIKKRIQRLGLDSGE